MEDVRKLVPRTPPEGLLEWTAERHKELEQDGLLIETESVSYTHLTLPTTERV